MLPTTKKYKEYYTYCSKTRIARAKMESYLYNLFTLYLLLYDYVYYIRMNYTRI